MVALNQVINANDIPARDDFSPVQPGTYIAMIVGSEMKPTGGGTGEMLVLEMDIVDGENQGRKLFDRLNLKNASDKAVEIAYKTLGEIIRAVGKVTIKDTEELHHKRFMVDVEIQPAKPYVDKDRPGIDPETGGPFMKPGKPQNSIRKYSPMGSSSAGSATGSPARGGQAGTTAQASGATGAPLPPWKRS